VKLRVAVIGVGPMGQGHARHYRDLPGCELVAVVDPDPARRAELAMRTGAQAFADVKDLIGRVDAVSIASPTVTHRDLALTCMEAGIHVLVEKPLAQSVKLAEEIVEAAKRNGVVLQVGHIERFNPAFKAAKEVVHDPRYMVADRLSPYSFRSRDISVVLDLMVHDLDIILEFQSGDIERVEAIGIPVLSPMEDMCDVRLYFKNGALADVRASRVSMQKLRKIRLFQQDAYLVIDYGSGSISTVRKSDFFRSGAIDPATLDASTLEDPFAFVFGRLLDVKHSAIESSDALRDELKSFLEACRGEHPPVVSGQDGLRAVKLADMIQDAVSDYLRREAGRAGIPLPSGLQRRTDRLTEPATDRHRPVDAENGDGEAS
jgi:predicted dehydrogenase